MPDELNAILSGIDSQITANMVLFITNLYGVGGYLLLDYCAEERYEEYEESENW